MKSGWGWNVRPQLDGRGRRGWMDSFVAAAPWITLGVLLIMMELVSGTLAVSQGVLFDLPDTAVGDMESTSLVALVMPMSHDTLVFFDDARFVLGDPHSEKALREQLAERAGKLRKNVLLVLADRRVNAGDMMALAQHARNAGIRKVLFAEKRADAPGEEP
ncbi:MAG: biopolymer transporter ExbD [Kiritimatiellae bacterium]|nr:biopolymer transporter ExbD [Kiritimatiellia bacterium]